MNGLARTAVLAVALAAALAGSGGVLAQIAPASGTAAPSGASKPAAVTPAAATPAPVVPAPAAAKPAAAKPTAKAVKGKPPTQPQFKLIVEPRAMELLKATSERLATARSMAFTAVVGYEYPSKLGPPLVYSTRYDVTMQRPDRLRVLIPGDGPASEFYYDGRTMVAYAPVENLAAIADAPPTIDAMLEAAYRNAAIFFPFEDLLLADPYAAMTKGVVLAYTIGPSIVVGGTRTDMVAWANGDVHLQIWIGSDDKLPRRIRAMYRSDPLALRHQVDFSDWKLDPVVPPETFASTRVKDAGRMDFKAPTLPAGVKPITLQKSSAAPARGSTAKTTN